MKSGKKLLLLLLVLAVVSAAAWAATSLSSQQEDVDTTVTYQSVYALDVETLTSLSWTYEDETLSFTSTADGWYYTPDSTFPLDEAYLDELMELLADVSSSKVISDPGSLDQYGLADPVCTITVNDTDTLLLGNETTMGGQRYFSNGDGAVYLVDDTLLDSFSYSLLDLVQQEEIPDLTSITGLTLTTETETLTLSYQPESGLAYSDTFAWFKSTASGYEAVDMEAMQALLDSFSGLAWLDCLDYKGSENLATYGLDNPAALYALTTEDGTFTLELGDGADDGSCYTRLRGSDLVYTIDAEVSTALCAVTGESLLVDDVLLLDYDTVQSVEVTLDGITYTFQRTLVTSEDQETEATEATDATVSQEWVWQLSGEEVDFGTVLDSLTAMTGQGLAEGITPEKGSEIRFLFHRNTDSFSTLELTFYQYDGTDCLVGLNGTAKQLAARQDVVAIIEAINALVL